MASRASLKKAFSSSSEKSDVLATCPNSATASHATPMSLSRGSFMYCSLLKSLSCERTLRLGTSRYILRSTLTAARRTAGSLSQSVWEMQTSHALPESVAGYLQVRLPICATQNSRRSGSTSRHRSTSTSFSMSPIAAVSEPAADFSAEIPEAFAFRCLAALSSCFTTFSFTPARTSSRQKPTSVAATRIGRARQSENAESQRNIPSRNLAMGSVLSLTKLNARFTCACSLAPKDLTEKGAGGSSCLKLLSTTRARTLGASSARASSAVMSGTHPLASSTALQKSRRASAGAFLILSVKISDTFFLFPLIKSALGEQK